MQFQVRTYHAPSGTITDSVMEAENKEAIERSLAREGLTPLSIVSSDMRFFGKRSAVFEVALFCEELRTLLSSGMSLVESIEALCSKSNEGDKHAVLLEIKQRLLEGKPLSAALEMNQFPFPPLLVASIRASERTSRIGEALDEYISYERVGQELKRKMVSAAIYPSLVVGFGLVVSLFMLSYVVPRFSKVYEDFAHSLSMSTVLLLKVGEFVGGHMAALAFGAAMVLASGVVLYRNGKLKKIVLRFLGKFGTAKHYLRQYQLARIYQTMSMLLKGGYTLSDAIPLAQNMAFEEDLRSQLVNASQSVMEGKRLSTAFAENRLTDSVTERLLQVGERSGNLAKVMDIIAQTYRQEFTLFVDRTTRLAEPILLMVVGVMIGGIIILMYMPVFDLAGGI